jgi:Skp family chaperone for outer membrane proteins
MKLRTCLLTIVALAAVTGIASVSWAQMQVGTVDLQRIRTESPEFKKALAQIDEMVSTFEKQRDGQKSELDKLAADLQDTESRGFKGTADRLRAEIQEKSQSFQQFMQETFGQDGIIEKNSAEGLKPMYEKLAEAAKSVAKTKGLDLILDLEQVNPLFASDRLDVTDAVLAEMAKSR